MAEIGGEQGWSGRVELLDSSSRVELVGSDFLELVSSNLIELELLGSNLIKVVSCDLVGDARWFDPGSGSEVVSQVTSFILVAVQAETPPGQLT